MIRSAMSCVRKAVSCSIFFVLLLSFTALSQNPIVTENALPGNPISEWGVPDFRDNRIAGFATKMSLNRGQTVRFKINVQSAATYTLKYIASVIMGETAPNWLPTLAFLVEPFSQTAATIHQPASLIAVTGVNQPTGLFHLRLFQVSILQGWREQEEEVIT